MGRRDHLDSKSFAAYADQHLFVFLCPSEERVLTEWHFRVCVRQNSSMHLTNQR